MYWGVRKIFICANRDAMCVPSFMTFKRAVHSSRVLEAIDPVYLLIPNTFLHLWSNSKSIYKTVSSISFLSPHTVHHLNSAWHEHIDKGQGWIGSDNSQPTKDSQQWVNKLVSAHLLLRPSGCLVIPTLTWDTQPWQFLTSWISSNWPTGPIWSSSRIVCVCVCLCVCLYVCPFSCSIFWGLFRPHFPKSDVQSS